VRLSFATAASPHNDGLVRAALKRAAVHDAVATIESDFPIAAGLGGSSAAGVALAAATHAWRGSEIDRAALAEWSRAVEVEELGIAGGRQDHYAAAFGGALSLDFGATTQVEHIPLSAAATTTLERQCLLAYTGESRISATTITAVIDGYRQRDRRVVSALEAMKAYAREMSAALRDGDIARLASLVGLHWREQRSLHPGISTERIDAIDAAAMRAGATGMKALGASGGGCVIVFAPDDRIAAVSRAIAPLAELLPWHVDTEGVTVTEDA
jgi:D-glycero-alpha-D-manno-heptose-7-phosphate kinase